MDEERNKTYGDYTATTEIENENENENLPRDIRLKQGEKQLNRRHYREGNETFSHPSGDEKDEEVSIDEETRKKLSDDTRLIYKSQYTFKNGATYKGIYIYIYI